MDGGSNFGIDDYLEANYLCMGEPINWFGPGWSLLKLQEHPCKPSQNNILQRLKCTST